MERKQILQWNLRNMWFESSSVSTVNLEKKSTVPEISIDFFLGLLFWHALYSPYGGHDMQPVSNLNIDLDFDLGINPLKPTVAVRYDIP